MHTQKKGAFFISAANKLKENGTTGMKYKERKNTQTKLERGCELQRISQNSQKYKISESLS